MEEQTDKRPIDLVAIIKALLPHWKKYLYVLPSVLIGTYLIIVCVPRYYTCTVSLAPETDGTSLPGSISSLAASFGIGALAKQNSQDAIYADIYPDVIASKNFLAELMTIGVETKKGDVKCSYYKYLRDYQKGAWWSVAMGKLKNLIKKPEADSYEGNEKISVFDLTKTQSDIFEAASGNIDCKVDKKTSVVTITVTDQDPRVCAIMADSTCMKLQDFIVSYRTNKARIDFEYYENLCKESKAEYEAALKMYAKTADSYTNTVMETYKSKVESLENEVQAKYSVYTAISTQLQTARAKLQEATPAFTVIESASVPTKPAGPKRVFISIGMMMLSFFVLTVRLLMKQQ